MNKQDFLRTITKPDGSYKRLNSVSTIRYPGGKTRAVGVITQYLPDDLPKKILSPFVGGASLEIAWANNLDVDEVIGCDINLPLVNYWQVQLSEPDKLADKLETLTPNRAEYKRVKVLVKEWYEGKRKLKEIDAAAYYAFNTQLSYGPMFPGYVSDKYLKQASYDRLCERIRTFRAPKLKVERLSFQESLKKYPRHFVYADPPYLLGYDSTVFCGMYPNRNWPTDHEGFPHEDFRDLMLKRKTEWLISYNDCGTIRKWFDGYEHTFPQWDYSFQRGETRKNGVKGARDNSKECKEILVVNSSYTLPSHTHNQTQIRGKAKKNRPTIKNVASANDLLTF